MKLLRFVARWLRHLFAPRGPDANGLCNTCHVNRPENDMGECADCWNARQW